MVDYKNIFFKAEKTIRNICCLTDEEFEKVYGNYKKYQSIRRSDEDCFKILTLIPFFSGFKAATVEKKEEIILGHFPSYKIVSEYDEQDVIRILSDPLMIKNERKVRGCIENARIFKNLVENYGSFMNYLDSFNINNSNENLILIIKELMNKFVFIGKITVYHLLTDLGYNVLKPDRVIGRIFKRLGLIENENQYDDIVKHGRYFAFYTGLPIRYIDIIFVKMGQQESSEKFGIKKGICLEKNPNCNLCGLTEYCQFYTNKNQNLFIK